jgi:hypothetical protein
MRADESGNLETWRGTGIDREYRLCLAQHPNPRTQHKLSAGGVDRIQGVGGSSATTSIFRTSRGEGSRFGRGRFDFEQLEDAPLGGVSRSSAMPSRVKV